MSVKKSKKYSLPNLLQSLSGSQHLRPQALRWCALFALHVEKFLDRHQLWGRRQVLVSLSGGADSMGLLTLAWLLRQRGCLQKVRALHFNHGTRPECASEEQLVKDFCQKLDIPLECHHLKLQFGANFEARARQLRRQFSLAHLTTSESLWQGHHCDDSLEWCLMQAFKSSQEILGIPTRHGAIVRPWMAASRAQIRLWCRYLSVPFAHDNSNQDTRFERNVMRCHLRPLRQQYPAMLHHYVQRSNRLARERQQHLTQASQQGPDVEIRQCRDLAGNQVFYTVDGSNDFAPARARIARALTASLRLQGVERSSLERPLQQLLQAVERGIGHGPMNFKAGVRAYWAPGRLAIVTPAAQKTIADWDTLALDPARLAQVFPYIAPLTEQMSRRHRGRRYRRPYPLWPRATQTCLEQGNTGWFYLAIDANSQTLS